eukprot:c26323_g1_i1.p1 GENE.c26323_g1_i1~~c26323_g1_i1.p1  ORF type:complete len:830 (+),score=119.58 c26323_g1_i1:204-2492(+)
MIEARLAQTECSNAGLCAVLPSVIEHTPVEVATSSLERAIVLLGRGLTLERLMFARCLIERSRLTPIGASLVASAVDTARVSIHGKFVDVSSVPVSTRVELLESILLLLDCCPALAPEPLHWVHWLGGIPYEPSTVELRLRIRALLSSSHQPLAIVSAMFLLAGNEELEASPSLLEVLLAVPVALAESAAGTVAVSDRISDEVVAVALRRILTWPLDSVVSTWIIALVRTLAGAEKTRPLVCAAANSMFAVWLQVVAQPDAPSPLAVLTALLLGCQSTPVLWHGLLPHLTAFLTESPASVPAALPDLAHTLMWHFSGYPELYAPLLAALEALPNAQPPPSEDTMAAELRQAVWVAVGVSAPVLALVAERPAGLAVGLVNGGNTCYANAFLQAMFHVPELAALVIGLRPSEEGATAVAAADCAVFAQLQRLFAFMKLSVRSSVSASALHKALPPPFNSAGQQDSSEFGRLMLGVIESAARLDSPASLAAFRSIAEASVRTTMRCTVCETVKERMEAAVDIQLPLGPDASTAEDLEALLAEHWRPEAMEGENAFDCEVCGCLVTAERTASMATLPRIAIISLNRFRFDRGAASRVKVMAPVRYPAWLPAAALGAADDGDAPYDLTAVVVHSGSSAHHGHYYCYARVGANSWMACNDASVHLTDLAALTAAGVRYSRDTPYMLLYRRREEAAPEAAAAADAGPGMAVRLLREVQEDNARAQREGTDRAVMRARPAWDDGDGDYGDDHAPYKLARFDMWGGPGPAF